MSTGSDQTASASPAEAAPAPPVPRNLGTFGLVLFLLSLTMLFGAALLGYLLIRLGSPAAPPPGTIEVPAALWLSTGIVLLVSVALAVAIWAVRKERRGMLRGAMVVTDLATVAFLAVQTPALIQLLNRHHVLVDSEGGTALYGLIFMLVLVHAGHVLGGLPPLAVVTANVFRDRYDHEDHRGLSYVAGYWHFLDVVWLVLFGVLVFTA